MTDSRFLDRKGIWGVVDAFAEKARRPAKAQPPYSAYFNTVQSNPSMGDCKEVGAAGEKVDTGRRTTGGGCAAGATGKRRRDQSGYSAHAECASFPGSA